MFKKNLFTYHKIKTYIRWMFYQWNFLKLCWALTFITFSAVNTDLCTINKPYRVKRRPKIVLGPVQLIIIICLGILLFGLFNLIFITLKIKWSSVYCRIIIHTLSVPTYLWPPPYLVNYCYVNTDCLNLVSYVNYCIIAEDCLYYYVCPIELVVNYGSLICLLLSYINACNPRVIASQ